MSLAVLAALLLVPAQDAPADPPDPAADAPPPLVELAPAAPPTKPGAPAAAPAPPPDKTPQEPKDGEPRGIGSVGVGAIQIAVGTGACCAGCCISVPFVLGLGLIPVVGGVLSSMGGNLIVGATIGVAETWAGDVWGQQRAALIWPVVASVGILTSSTALSIVASIVEPRVPPDPTQVDPNNPASLANAIGTAGGGPITTISAYYGLAACVGAIVVPAIVYAVMAEDKKPGDDGGFPGIMEPAHPTTTTTTMTTTMTTTTTGNASSATGPLAMRY